MTDPMDREARIKELQDSPETFICSRPDLDRLLGQRNWALTEFKASLAREKILNKFIIRANKITSQWRHLGRIDGDEMDLFCNQQIEAEQALAEIKEMETNK